MRLDLGPLGIRLDLVRAWPYLNDWRWGRESVLSAAPEMKFERRVFKFGGGQALDFHFFTGAYFIDLVVIWRMWPKPDDALLSRFPQMRRA